MGQHDQGREHRDGTPSRWIAYQIERIQLLASNVLRVLLSPQSSEGLVYAAGQYLEIHYPDGSWQPFSIANAPDNNCRIELHIRQLQSDRLTTALIQQLRDSKQIRIRGPYGKAHYRNAPDFPVILIAGGTGFAYIKAIVEAAMLQNDTRPLHFFWGAKKEEDFYLSELLPLWREQLKKFQHTLITSQPHNPLSPNQPWLGKTGYVYNAVLAEYANLAAFQVYASGPAPMIKDTFHHFKQHGLNPGFMFSDML